MFAEPPRTDFDLVFKIGSIPVRVHPMFWLMGLLLGGRSGGLGPLVWTGVLFLSILVHELGHVLAYKRYGHSARVLLYSFGGLAISSGAGGQLRPMDRIFVSFAGPLAGFLLAALVVFLAPVMGVKILYTPLVSGLVPSWTVTAAPNLLWAQFIGGMIYVNIFWGLMNLLPIIPLDGGRISEQVFGMAIPRDGMRHAVVLSIIVAGLVCCYGLMNQQFFIAAMFGYLAWINIQSVNRPY